MLFIKESLELKNNFVHKYVLCQLMYLKVVTTLVSIRNPKQIYMISIILRRAPLKISSSTFGDPKIFPFVDQCNLEDLWS